MEMAAFTIQIALGRLLKAWGIVPTVLLGSGVGEYAAACMAGVFGVQDAVKLIGARGSANMQKAVSGMSFATPRVPIGVACGLILS